MEVRLGKYKHYKGKEYQVIGIAKHSETLNKFVIYKSLYGKKQFWTRPLKMFNESVKINGVKKKRFKFIGEK